MNSIIKNLITKDLRIILEREFAAGKKEGLKEAQKFINMAAKEGRCSGFKKGHNEGFKTGKEEGFKKGLEFGKRIDHNNAFEDGHALENKSLTW